MPGSTSRAAIPYTQGADGAATIDDTSLALANRLDLVMPMFAQGVAASRGAATTPGRFYYATDTGQLSYSNGTSWLDLSAAAATVLFQTGDLKTTLAAAAPSGWLMCDGSQVARSTYGALFAVVGTQHNIGGEAGTDFRLPDLRGRGIVGKGLHTDVDTLGDNEGILPANANLRTPRHLHTVAAHSHSVPAHAHAVASHQHTIDDNVTNIAGARATGEASLAFPAQAGQTNHDHSISGVTHFGGPTSTSNSAVLTTGTDTPATDLQGQAYLVANVMVKT